METKFSEFDKDGEGSLKNFLKGMETSQSYKPASSRTSLKNFLKGMETVRARAALEQARSPQKLP